MHFKNYDIKRIALEQPLLTWHDVEYSKKDIGGKAFKTCATCGGEKVFSNGDDDYGDSTEQYIKCTSCGWTGYRLIKYGRWGDSKTIFRQAVLKKWQEPTHLTETLQQFKKARCVLKIKGSDYQLRVLQLNEEEAVELYFDKKYYLVSCLEHLNIDWRDKSLIFKFQINADNSTYSIGLNMTFKNSERFLKQLAIKPANAPKFKTIRRKIGQFNVLRFFSKMAMSQK